MQKLAIIVVLLAVCPGTARTQGAAIPREAAAAEIEQALAVFDKQNAREQKRTLAAVRAAVDQVEDDYLRAVRGAITAGRKLVSKSKLKARQKQHKPAGAALWSADLPFPIEHEYAFGFAKAYAIQPPADRRHRRIKKARREAQLRRARLLGMMHGCLPDLDLALAALLADLDHDRHADAFSRLLESWRNGTESFYHALDRTAGTSDSVFFYDAMLDDFIVRCVPKDHADYETLRRSLNAAHDALHDAFLAYRQYRAFREAIALSLLLPPDTPLPPALKRYEEAPKGQYSTRDQIVMLLRASKQDIAAVITAIKVDAPPVNASLWQAKYDPYPAFQRLVKSKQPAFLAIVDNTDKLAPLERSILAASRQKVADAARAAFLARTTHRSR